MKTSSLILTIAALGAVTATADAQGRGKAKGNQGVPPGQRPPAGMCRIWIDNVPPGQQPAPTDCDTAVRNQPPNSQIIWGDNTTRRDQNAYDSRRNDRSRDGRYDRRRDDRNDRDRNRNDNDRYRRGANGQADSSCIDNDRNGWCDYHPEQRSGVRVNSGNVPGNPPANVPGNTNGGSTPVDRGQYPSELPAMTGAVLIRVGVRSADVQNWLGRSDLRSETVDSNGDGVPEQASWFDGSGTLLQVWRDDDRDGRADSVEIYRNGQRAQVIR